MPTWAWVLTILLAPLVLGALALLLLRFRYFLEWRGEWTGTLSGSAAGSVRVETRFLWFQHAWEPLKDPSWSLGDLFGDEEPEENKTEADPGPEIRFSEERASAPPKEEPVFLKSSGTRKSETQNSQGRNPPRTSEKPREEKEKKNPHRARRALFRLVTDREAWKLLGRYGLKTVRLALRLLKPRIEAAVGHPDPAFLGRAAGKWYIVRPFLLSALPAGRADLYFRFQDRNPSLWVRVQGSFSALSLLGFGIRLLIAFPSIRLIRRGLRSWRRHRLTGWRAWVYRKLQTH